MLISNPSAFCSKPGGKREQTRQTESNKKISRTLWQTSTGNRTSNNTKKGEGRRGQKTFIELLRSTVVVLQRIRTNEVHLKKFQETNEYVQD